jgi:hypothetical protein
MGNKLCRSDDQVNSGGELMSLVPVDELDFYRQQTDVTDPGEFAGLFAELPDDLPASVTVLQDALVHRDGALWRFGVLLSEERYAEGETRRVRDILATMGSLDRQPPEQRFAGTCRDYCVVLCSMLRYRGIPTRIRGGFGNYNWSCGGPRLFDDHWLVEYWTEQHGWRRVDAQVAGQAATDYRVEFDAFDVPRDRWVAAGQAWQEGRAGTRDVSIFVVSGLRRRGLDMIRGTLLRDLAALNNIEGFPWEMWGLMTGPFEDLGPSELALLDRAAEISAKGGPLDDARRLYAGHAELRVS